MNYKLAKDLHNGDEITVKSTGEITTVISTETTDKDVFVYAMTEDGYTKLRHDEFK